MLSDHDGYSGAPEGYPQKQKHLTDLVLKITEPEAQHVLPIVAGIKSLSDEETDIYWLNEPVSKLAEALRGFTAPDSWAAIMVSSQGESTSEDEECNGDVVVGYGVGREGEEVSVIRFEGQEPNISTLQSGGKVPDYCRRAMGVPTLPAVDPVQDLLVATWLHRVLVFCACHEDVKTSRRVSGHLQEFGDLGAGKFSHSSELDWDCVASLHMFVEDSDLIPPPEELGQATASVCATGGWEKMRQLIATGKVGSFIDADVAEWMDSGLLSRELTGAQPDIDVMLGMLEDMVPGELWVDIRDCVNAHY